ncbi:MAG: hypothetical protein AAFR61_27995 [Bacteroidota bacterium]
MLLETLIQWLEMLLPKLSLLVESGANGWGLKVSLFFLSFVKFAIAAITAMPLVTKISFLDFLIFVGGGAIISVVVYAYFGEQIRKWIVKLFPRNPDKERNLERQARRQAFWKKYGLVGVAFLAPFISPMASVGIAISFKERPARIILYTGISILAWTLIFAAFRNPVHQLIQTIFG